MTIEELVGSDKDGGCVDADALDADGSASAGDAPAPGNASATGCSFFSGTIFAFLNGGGWTARRTVAGVSSVSAGSSRLLVPLKGNAEVPMGLGLGLGGAVAGAGLDEVATGTGFAGTGVCTGFGVGVDFTGFGGKLGGRARGAG